jgi:hypothetical protein
LEVDADWGCAIQTGLMGIIPGLLFYALLRRLPIRTAGIACMAALAVGSFAVLGTSLYHTEDSSVTFLVWHVGAAVLVTAACSLIAGLASPALPPVREQG